MRPVLLLKRVQRACVRHACARAGNTVSGGVSQAAAEAYAAKKKPKEVSDFYRFQAREKKKTEMVDLRRKFADAQKHLQDMRTTRKFKPD
jgi:ribosomal RNA-processing protein 7